MQRFLGLTGAGLLCLTFGLTPSVEATLVTDTSLFGPSLVIDFSQFGPGYGFTNGPTEIGGLVGFSTTFTAAGGKTGASVLGNGFYGLLDNGTWDTGPGGNAYSGSDGGQAYMRYTFNAKPVLAVGGFINYATPGLFDPPTITVFATDGVTVLESYNLALLAPISTPGGVNAGAFRGIVRPQGDIGAFQVSNSFIVLDDLTFEPVPEPGTLLLIGTGLMGLALRRRRRS